MGKARVEGRYDQGFFNTACALVDEIATRSHLFFLMEVDVAEMDRIRAEAKLRGDAPPTYTSFVIKAAATALRENPHLNCVIEESPFHRRLVQIPEVTATVAVERMVDGIDMVFAPQLERPDERSLDDITAELRNYADADVTEIPAFDRFLKLVRLSTWLPTLTRTILRMPMFSSRLWRKYRGGSFAVTSPGKYGGADQVLPPWGWPITFGFGHIKKRPWVDGDEVVVRKTMRLTIVTDRRLANGAPLARFGERVRILLERPAQMVPTEEGDRRSRPRTVPAGSRPPGDALVA